MASFRPRRKQDNSILEELRELDLLESGGIIDIPDLEIDDLIEENKKSIVVRCLNKQVHKVGALIKALPSIWGCEEKVKGRGISEDKAQFHFDREEDLIQILEKGPWFVNGWILVVERWSPNPDPIYLQKIQFWIRIKGIPVHLLKRQTVECIIGTLGEVVDVELHAKNSNSVEYVRARAWVKADEPLQFVKEARLKSGEILQLEFTYEKLLKVCYICKRLTHDMTFCPYQVNIEGARHSDTHKGRKSAHFLKGKGKSIDSRIGSPVADVQNSKKSGDSANVSHTPRSAKERLQWVGKRDRNYGKKPETEWRARDSHLTPANQIGSSKSPETSAAKVYKRRRSLTGSKDKGSQGSVERSRKKAKSGQEINPELTPSVFDRLGENSGSKEGKTRSANLEGSGSKSKSNSGSKKSDSGKQKVSPSVFERLGSHASSSSPRNRSTETNHSVHVTAPKGNHSASSDAAKGSNSSGYLPAGQRNTNDKEGLMVNSNPSKEI